MGQWRCQSLHKLKKKMHIEVKDNVYFTFNEKEMMFAGRSAIQQQNLFIMP